MSLSDGITTVEGQVAGSVAAAYAKEREKERLKFEETKAKIKEINNVNVVVKLSDKFKEASYLVQTHHGNPDLNISNIYQMESKKLDKADTEEIIRQKEKEKTEKEKKRKQAASMLSFDNDDGDLDEEDHISKKIMNKNPNVDTTFLADRERDKKIEEEKLRLKREWLDEQQRVRKEQLEVTYSYWDGSGHRQTIIVEKGITIMKFLEKVKGELSSKFKELRSMSSENLMYVKEDTIMPHNITFYDLITQQARSKSGSKLFNFNVQEDIRIVGDIRLERDDSHPGKVIDRRYYEKNKHIFPYSKYEMYDPHINPSTH